MIIYAADRVANMRDWHKIAPEDRPACGERLGTTLDERLELWTEDVEELHDLDPQTPFLGEIESELAALQGRDPAPVTAPSHPASDSAFLRIHHAAGRTILPSLRSRRPLASDAHRLL